MLMYFLLISFLLLPVSSYPWDQTIDPKNIRLNGWRLNWDVVKRLQFVRAPDGVLLQQGFNKYCNTTPLDLAYLGTALKVGNPLIIRIEEFMYNAKKIYPKTRIFAEPIRGSSWEEIAINFAKDTQKNALNAAYHNWYRTQKMCTVLKEHERFACGIYRITHANGWMNSITTNQLWCAFCPKSDKTCERLPPGTPFTP